MKSMLQAEVREEVRRRLATIPADRPPKWGRMDATQMMAHVADAMRMGLGDLAVTEKRLPFRYPPFKQLILYVIPFPKNAPTATELLSRPPLSIDEERAAIGRSLERLATRDPAAQGPTHPIFGALTVRQWGTLGYKHMDHHLRQFGA